MTYLSVAVGGALGAVLRYAATGWLHTWTGLVFPIGTLTVNVVGSLIIGVVLELTTDRLLLPLETRLLLTTGFCGGLTTFSTFSYETLALLQEQQWLPAAGNLLLNVVLCIAAASLGVLLARTL